MDEALERYSHHCKPKISHIRRWVADCGFRLQQSCRIRNCKAAVRGVGHPEEQFVGQQSIFYSRRTDVKQFRD